jgi:hypothetical protein
MWYDYEESKWTAHGKIKDAHLSVFQDIVTAFARQYEGKHENPQLG